MLKRIASLAIAVLLSVFVSGVAFAEPEAPLPTSGEATLQSDVSDGGQTEGQLGGQPADDTASENASSTEGESGGDGQPTGEGVAGQSGEGAEDSPSAGGQPGVGGDTDGDFEGTEAAKEAAKAADDGGDINPDDPYSEIDKLAGTYRGTLEDGQVYFLNAALSETAVLDVYGYSQSNSGNAVIYSYNGKANQQWRVSHDEKGYVTLTAVHSGLVLDVNAARTSNGTNVQQYESNGTLAQKWIAIPVGDGLIELHSALDFSMVLDVSAAGTKDGTNIQIYESNGTDAQRFRPYLVYPDVAPCADLGLDGWYTIGAAGSPSFVLDISAASTANGANVQIYSSNGTTAQLFRFEYVDGYYLIINARSGKALDADNACRLRRTNIHQWELGAGDTNRLFALVDNGDGTYSFVNKVTGLYLDIAGASYKNGTNVWGYLGNGTTAQRFVLTPVTEFLSPGLVEISFGSATGQRLDVSSASWAEGANVVAYQQNGTIAQKWYVSKVSGESNTYTIESVIVGSLLTEDSNGNICVRSATGSDNQRWRGGAGNGGFTLTNVATGHVLSVTNLAASNGTNVQGSGSAAGLLFSSTNPVPDGIFFIKVRSNLNSVIDLKSASTSNGAAIQLYAKNDTGAQKWKITKNSDGSYQILNAMTLKAMDAEGGAMAEGTKIQQWQALSTNPNQKWLIEYVPGEGYRIAPYRDLSYSMTATGNSTANGSRMVLAADAGKTTQRFSLESTSSPMTTDQLAMYNKAQSYYSSTSWLILVNCTTNRVGIFTGSKNNWQMEYYWECCTGAPSSPTVIGEYTVGTRGYSFDGHGYTCYYYTQFYGDYLFHSQVYDQGTFNIQDGSMGVNVSAGCVRLYLDRAKWIYNNIPRNTKVVTYR